MVQLQEEGEKKATYEKVDEPAFYDSDEFLVIWMPILTEDSDRSQATILFVERSLFFMSFSGSLNIMNIPFSYTLRLSI